MATTVRQVKRHSKSVKNSNQFVTTAEVEGYGPYKPVPPPKPLTAGPAASPPPYRMPPYPLYSEPSIPGSAGGDPTHSNLHTHSSKFPIEREVILSSTDKNSKIPILNEYRKRPKGAIAPDAPHIQLAWTEDRRDMDQIHSHPQDNVGAHQLYKAQPMTLLDSSRVSEPSPINGFHSGQGSSTGAVPRTPAAHSTPEGEGNSKPFPSRTYHTIKDIISSKFNKRNDKVEELSPQSQLRQHGVYLGTPSNSGPTQPPPSSAEIMRRNQEIQRQIKEMKEAQDDGGFQEVMGRNYNTAGSSGGPRHSMIEMETPRRPPQSHTEPSPHHQRSAASGSGSVMRPGDVYGRHYPDTGGYGVPGTRRSVSEAESARKVEAARREERYYFQQQNQPRHTDPRASKEMESMGVYVSRNPGDRTSKTPESRTPDFSRKTERDSRTPDFHRKSELLSRTPDLERRIESENRVLRSQSVERLDSRDVNGDCRIEMDREKERDREKEEEDDEEGGFKGGAGGQSDSGRGSTVYSSGKAKTERNIDTSPEPNTVTGPGDAGWVDMVESELRHILDPKLHLNIANSTMSESISSMTPPLPPLSPGGSSSPSPSPDYKHKSLPYNSKPEFSVKPRGGQNSRAVWSARVGAKDKSSHHRLPPKTSSKLPSALLCSSLELDSMLDEENNSSDEDTTIDTTDTRAIRKQLEGLENMYSEVLKLLGVKKQAGGRGYQPSDPRVHKRRLYGSLSSLPSSVSSRPIRDKRRHDQERKKVKDIKGINKRFQRLESHVVTLARSVAHLSSEMRTQHLMIQEMEVIRGELAALRTQSNMATARSHSMPRALNRISVEQSNSNPERVKKLTKFFGDEPPLLRLFLKKLGYEKYAAVFENERIGLVELPYLTEERLHKLGIPLGPRLRIMQEAQLGFPVPDNTLCIV
ncbi:uncharacterized protein LOC128985166 [Macrosteles quadrilineatus]|uniref:uncharacterized protein LOC128985166 n=1 Tax=Macrosteles quadrilineatus TaxID=74068 RepID=UPI0023E08F8D|nr:uncharacterized protein LOC128985166 [Macrosteles quadrilineatus]